MKTDRLALKLSAVLLWSAAVPRSPAEAAPVILNIMPTGSGIELQWQANPASTQWVERAASLSTNPIVWTPVFTNTPPTQATNTWVDLQATNFTGAFYRIRAQEISSKIGQTATFITHYHGVSGTAEIIDAQTIRVTNFNYDGGGILVYMIVASNSGFAPYTAISGDLVRGAPYVNETLDFTIPPGTTLEDINYISVWCVDVSISFGDGQFQ